MRLAPAENAGASRIRHDVYCALVVVVKVSERLSLQRGVAAQSTVEFSEKFPAAAEFWQFCAAGREGGNVGGRINVEWGECTGEEAGADEPDLGERVEADERGQGIRILATGSVLVGDDRSHRRQFRG